MIEIHCEKFVCTEKTYEKSVRVISMAEKNLCLLTEKGSLR